MKKAEAQALKTMTVQSDRAPGSSRKLQAGGGERILPNNSKGVGTYKTTFLAVVSSPPLQRLGHHISQRHRFNLDIGSCIEMVDPRFDYGDTVG
jgi:hypothetical protein